MLLAALFNKQQIILYLLPIQVNISGYVSQTHLTSLDLNTCIHSNGLVYTI